MDEKEELKKAVLFRSLNKERILLSLALEKENNNIFIAEQISAIDELMRDFGLEL
jgi:hypothetical protein